MWWCRAGQGARGHGQCSIHPTGTGVVSHCLCQHCPGAGGSHAGLNSPSVSLLSPCHINYHLPCQGQKTTFTALVLIKKSDFPILAA